MEQENLKQLYSYNLKLIKKNLNLTASELAEKLGMPVRTIGSYERQENICSAQLITALCKKLNVNANWFVTGEGNMFNAPQYGAVKNELRSEVLQILKDEGIIK